MSIRKIAVCVGVNKYSMPDSDLKLAVADAQSVAEVLGSNRFGYETRVLLDEEATVRSVTRELIAARDLAPAQLIFYFAGHGATTASGTYLVTHDSEFIEDSLDVTRVGKLLESQPEDSTATLILLDCCHSGASTIRALGARRATISDFTRSVETSTSSRALLAACLPDEESWELSEFGHGLFTYYLLEALEGKAVDSRGRITVAGLYKYISAPFESDTRQTPVLKGDLYGDLAIADGFEPSIDTKDSATPEQREPIIAQARELLDSYTSRPGTTREHYLHTGYQESCRALEPVVLWFEKQLGRNEKFAYDDEFMALYHAAWSEAGHLARLTGNLSVVDGKTEEFIGEGTFGTVWKVRVGANRLAYKVYSPTEMRNHEKLKRFRQGYNAMRQLNHPSIVKVHSFTQCPLGFYMDYVDGPNLREMGSPSDEPDEVVAILLKVAVALRHAHNLGVIHRDVKPENIVMAYSPETGKYEPSVTDFDLAWFTTATQLTNQAIGALSYAAPEQLAPRVAEAARQPAVDVYAFGQLAYFCVLNSHPVPLDFEGNERRLSAAVRRWENPAVAERYLELHRGCNARDPIDRLASMQDCVDALMRVNEELESASRNDALPVEDVLHGLSYRLAGVRELAFSSSSGRTHITLRHREHHRKRDLATIEARLRPLQDFNHPGKPMAQRRAEINRQIDQGIAPFSWASRRAGNDPGFEVFIDMKNIRLRHAAISNCQGVLDRVIEAMER